MYAWDKAPDSVMYAWDKAYVCMGQGTSSAIISCVPLAVDRLSVSTDACTCTYAGLSILSSQASFEFAMEGVCTQVVP